MGAGHFLARPAVAEVRAMLQRIKLDNMERGRKLAGSIDSCSLNAIRNVQILTRFQPTSIDTSLIFNAGIKPVARNYDEMGSFTSMPQIKPAADADDNDVDYGGSEKIGLTEFLDKCTTQLGSLPPPIPRKWRTRTPIIKGDSEGQMCLNSAMTSRDSEQIRVFQWNALSQALGTGNDNFVKCPASALEWRTRRFRMLEEIARHNADVICLQEVDRFQFLRKSLASLGYVGHFIPKPDSPCLYLADNAGPDGCAIFYKKDKFDLVKIDSRVLEVWRVQSNQIGLSATLKSKKTGQEVVFATTHLKARNGALMPTLRNEQVKDLLGFLVDQAGKRPVICCGDFNAQPDEPAYQTMTSSRDLRLTSAYLDSRNKEPEYTTWKIREDGEHIQTLDYMFHTEDQLRVEAVLNMPTEEQIGKNRLPSLSYASDHFSLVADFKLISSSN